MHLVIVESPAKAKTINKYLGPDYKVLASYGHVRDLPPRDGSVRPDEDFAMSWEVDAKASKRLSEIAEAAKASDRIILATDPDREGEAISWHVLDVLQQKRVVKDKPVERVVFNAITRSAVTEAMKAPRQIDMELVKAYLARRALDYLVGFNLSPVLWRKLPGARSAGRVQSVALRLVVDREIEIERFITREYWTVEADMTSAGAPFTARLAIHEGRKLTKFDLGDEAAAAAARQAVISGAFTISAVEKKPARRSPAPPFTTSTLQQEAARKLGFSAQRTMQAAQKLYEGIDIGGETVGLITYMRTDGVQSAPEALQEARQVISGLFGADYVPESARQYRTKARNAQEAHEAIRPTSLARNPGSLRLEGDLGRLYELIWKRMLASQMESARIERTTVDLLLAGRVMYPIDQGRPAGLEGLGRTDVRLDHHLFDELVRWQDRAAADRSDPALGVHHNPALRALDGQGRAGPPRGQEPVVGGVEGFEDGLQQGAGHIIGGPLNGGLGLFVGQLGGGSHQSPHESVPGLPPRGVEDHPHGNASPVLAGPKTAQSRR